VLWFIVFHVYFLKIKSLFLLMFSLCVQAVFGSDLFVAVFCSRSGMDTTRHGHIIGAAQVRVPAPERQMTAASSSVVRLLLHMSMFLGATESPQVVVCFS